MYSNGRREIYLYPRIGREPRYMERLPDYYGQMVLLRDGDVLCHAGV